MFEHIVMRNSLDGATLTAGELAEAILFYGKLKLILTPAQLIQLMKGVGIELFFNLVKNKLFSVSTYLDIPGVHTEDFPTGARYGLVLINLVDKENKDPYLMTLERSIVAELGYETSAARQLARRILNTIPCNDLAQLAKLKTSINLNAEVYEEFENTLIIKNGISEALKYTEGVPKDYDFNKFELIKTKSGFYVFTDIDFNLINISRHNLNHKLEPINISHLFAAYFDASIDTKLAKANDGDFYTSDKSSAIIRASSAGSILSGMDQSAHQLGNFRELVIGNFPIISELINSQQKSFNEFMVILDKAAKFRHWLTGVSPDENSLQNILRLMNWTIGQRVGSLKA